MTEQDNQQPKIGKDILPMDDLRIDYHAISRFSLRQGTTVTEAAEQLRTRLGESVLIRESDSGPASQRRGRKKAKRGFPELVFRDSLDSSLRYVVRRNDKESYFLATTFNKERTTRGRKKF